MGLHFSNKTSLKTIELSTKMHIASILLHLHSLGIINHLQFSTSIPTHSGLTRGHNKNDKIQKKILFSSNSIYFNTMEKNRFFIFYSFLVIK